MFKKSRVFCFLVILGPRLQKWGHVRIFPLKQGKNELDGSLGLKYVVHIKVYIQYPSAVVEKKMTIVLKQMGQHLTVCETL